MIEQVLDRDFIVDRIRKALSMLRGEDLSQQGEVMELLERQETTAEEVAEALGRLESSLSKNERDEAREPTPEAGVCWIPQDAELSLFQSVLTRFYEEERPELIEEGGAGAGAAPETVPVTDRRLTAVDEPGSARELFERFSKTDIGWATVLTAKAVRFARRRHPFNQRPAEPLPIGDRCRVVLLGDWGSGIPRARSVAGVIREELERGAREGRQQHVVHLGDVYYSGWAREYRKNFLRYWPVRASEADAVTSWSLNANHDMYSGGQAYFKTLLADPRFARQQGSSFFSFENRHWTVLGLDTAYEDHDLCEPQPEWVRRRLEEAAAAGRKGLLLSHHQLFDAKGSDDGRNLRDKLQQVLGQGHVRAWFWGHEHECTLFRQHQNVAFARCVGHAGVPVYAKSGDLPDHVLYQYRDSFRTAFESWARLGFAVLDFEDERIEVRYVNELGKTHKRERIE